MNVAPRPVTRRPSVLLTAAGAVFLSIAVTPSPTVAEGPPGPAAASLWLAPSDSRASTLADAIDLVAAGKAARALPALERASRDADTLGYGLLYLGRAQLQAATTAEATATARALLATHPTGYLREASLWLAADVAEKSNDWSGALRHLQALVSGPSLTPERAYLRLGLAAMNDGNRELAVSSLTKAYYDFALTPESAEAAGALAKLASTSSTGTPDGLRLELGRAQQLFFAKRYADARPALMGIRSFFSGDDRALIDLRLAEIDFGQKHYAAARDALRAYFNSGPSTSLRAGALWQDEAQYYYLGTLRELGQRDDYIRQVHQFVESSVESPYAEEALNDLGTYFILQSDDASAAEVFAEQYRRYPTGARAERAAWKSGWWAYRTKNYAAVIQTFEPAAIAFRRSDFRPPWLYWAAKAHLQLGERDRAIAGFRQVIAAYRNSYYGRLAARAMESLGARVSGPSDETTKTPLELTPGTAPPNGNVIRRLLALGLYDDAILEVRTAELAQGQTPILEATIAYALNRKGELRPGITAMRRAYPQFLAEGGEVLPTDILRVIFPVAHWDLIRRYATLHKLDPFVMAALVAQESTFDAKIKSSANAWGLMQVVPSTGRQYAQLLGIRHFQTARLTDPDTNLRIGMAYFSDLLKQFGGDLATTLAAYNAGDSRVARWRADRGNLDRDEFIDDIPFPETQNYVKRILGTAEDYRKLYGQ